MSTTTTRISDLPENITMQMPSQSQQYPFSPPGSGMPGSQSISQQQHQSQQQQQQGISQGISQGIPRNSVISTGIQQTSGQDSTLGNNTYMPMNIHPNPFSQGQQQSEMPLPQNVHQSIDPFRTQQDQHLPSRDIPMDAMNYTHDEAIQPNYIPKPTDPTDYIKIYEEGKQKKLQKIEEEKYRKETVDDLITQFQTPVFVALLYFIFQMPVFNQLLYKYLSVLPIFRQDGNINLYGMILKSGGFALVYFSLNKIINYFQYL
jgi:hypothetical protein